MERDLSRHKTLITRHKKTDNLYIVFFKFKFKIDGVWVNAILYQPIHEQSGSIYGRTIDNFKESFELIADEELLNYLSAEQIESLKNAFFMPDNSNVLTKEIIWETE